MKQKPPKELRAFKVFAIKEGTVIDHINVGHAIKIIRLLNLADEKKVVTVGLNFQSKNLGMKDLIKVEKRELTPEEISQVAVLAPEATINIIRNYKVTKKFKAQIPELIEYVIVCPNPNCITNHENIRTKFHVRYEKKNINLKCNYCERLFVREEIKEYKNN